MTGALRHSRCGANSHLKRIRPKHVCPNSLHYKPGRGKIFLFTTASRPGIGAHSATNGPSSGGGEGNRVKLTIHLHPVLVLNTWNMTSIPPCVFIIRTIVTGTYRLQAYLLPWATSFTSFGHIHQQKVHGLDIVFISSSCAFHLVSGRRISQRPQFFSPVRVHRRFGEIYCLHLQYRRVR
jgi:hypothetical protein